MAVAGPSSRVGLALNVSLGHANSASETVHTSTIWSVRSRWLCDHCVVGVPAIQASKFQLSTGVARQFGEFRLEFRPRIHRELTQPSEQYCLEPPGPSLLLTEVQNVQPAAGTDSFERLRQHLPP